MGRRCRRERRSEGKNGHGISAWVLGTLNKRNMSRVNPMSDYNKYYIIEQRNNKYIYILYI